MIRVCDKCGEKYASTMDFCPKDGHKLSEVDTDPADRLLGKSIDGRFLITEKIGVGGMGTVYKAQQKSIGRAVAVKVLNKDLAHDKEAVQRFFLEARAASLLSNAHTITIHDFGQDGENQLYIAMELLDGQPLSDIMKEQWPFDLPFIIEIIKQICDSLGEAHKKGIIHRDLKPANICLCDVGEEENFVKVLDFGIAKLVESTTQNNLTRTGAIMGTPIYMSPEQARGDVVDNRTDFYSLGIILYEMLSGRPPFNASTPHKLLMCHIEEPPPALSEVNPSAKVPPDLEMVVRRMLEKKPEERYQTAAELKADLDLVLEKLKDEGLTPIWRPVRSDTASYGPEKPTSVLSDDEQRVFEDSETELAPDGLQYPTPFYDKAPSEGRLQTPTAYEKGRQQKRKRWGLLIVLLVLLGGGAAGLVIALKKEPAAGKKPGLAGVAGKARLSVAARPVLSGVAGKSGAGRAAGLAGKASAGQGAADSMGKKSPARAATGSGKVKPAKVAGKSEDYGKKLADIKKKATVKKPSVKKKKPARKAKRRTVKKRKRTRRKAVKPRKTKKPAPTKKTAAAKKPATTKKPLKKPAATPKRKSENLWFKY